MDEKALPVDPEPESIDNQKQPKSRASRRAFIGGGAAAIGAASFGLWRWVTAGPPTFDTTTLLGENQLPIPPLVEDLGAGISLTAHASTTEFIVGSLSQTWGFNQPFLGPTIRVRRGSSVAFSVANQVSESITSHWHGLHIPGNIDGGPFNLIEPGDTWNFTMDIAQQASTNWYHSHVHGRTGQHVYLGLAGMFLIEDENSDVLDLPSSYGIDDIPLIVSDRTFLEDGTLYSEIGNGVFLGESIVVNGTIGATLELPAKKNRLRLLNAANGRLFDFSLDDGTGLTKIATEGGFLNAPVEIESAFLTPGERMEVIVDLSGHAIGDEVVIQSRNVNGDGAFDETFEVLRIRVVSSRTEDNDVPTILNTVPDVQDLLASVDIAAERSFILRGNAINGEQFDHHLINHVTERGTWERWTVNGGAHPFHVHGCSFLVLSRNGQAVQADEAGWRDTIQVGQGVELLLKFDFEAPPEATYMYHCHLMGHEDAGMMGQFAVVDDPSSIDLETPMVDT